MDMNCRKCREPWDWWHVRDTVLELQPLYMKIQMHGGYIKEDGADGPYEILPTFVLMGRNQKRSLKEMQRLADWQFGPGPYILQCPACIGTKVKLTEKQEFRSEVESAMADVLGDDIDGMMAEMEDLDFLLGE